MYYNDILLIIIKNVEENLKIRLNSKVRRIYANKKSFISLKLDINYVRISVMKLALTKS